jgi:hypothetical protein
MPPQPTRTPRKTSVIVPFYNSRRSCAHNLRLLSHFLSTQAGTWEVIAVDDGSTDGTAEALATAAASLPGVSVLGAERNIGKGACLGQAMRVAEGERILFIDGDLPFPLEGLLRLNDGLEAGDVAVACRERPHPGKTDLVSVLRGNMSLVFSFLTRLLLPEIRDTQAGMKGFRREAVARIVERQTDSGFCFDLEALVVARVLGLSVVQVDLPWHGHDDSTVRLARDVPAMLAGFLGIAVRLFAGAYERPIPRAWPARLREVEAAPPGRGEARAAGVGESWAAFIRENPAFLLVPLASALIFAWFLPELRHVSVSLNDGVLHYSVVRGMDRVWNRGGDIFDFWQENSGAGHAFIRTSHFLMYLTAWAVRRATLATFSVESCFAAVLFATVVLLPWSFYAGGRLLGLGVAESAVAAALFPLVRDAEGYGISLWNFTFAGHGLYNEAFGLLTFPIAIGLIYRALKGPRMVIPAAIVYSLLWMSHLFLGYMVFCWSLVCAAYLAAADSRRWDMVLGRWLGVQAIFAVVSCGLIVPILQDRMLQLRSLDEPAYRFLGQGAGAVMSSFLSGRFFDAECPVPLLSFMVAGGFAYCCLRLLAGRTRWAESAEGLIATQAAVAFVLSFGPKGWAGVFTWLPFTEDVHWHRFIGSAQVMLLYAAGCAAVAGGRLLLRRFPGAAPWAGLALAAALGLKLVGINDFFLGLNRRNLVGVEKAWAADSEFHRILRFALRHDNARVYAGNMGNFGKETLAAPGYPFLNALNEYNAGNISMLYHTLGLSSPLNFSMDFSDREDSRLVNARYLVLPSGMPAPAAYRPILAGPTATLYDNGNDEGFFMLGTPAAARCADNDSLYYSIRKWIRGPGQDSGTFPEIVLEDECPRGPDSILNAVDEVGPVKTMGRILKSGVAAGKSSAHYWAKVAVDSPGLIVFKMEYHPSWRVLVNGRPAKTFMVLPAFMAVRVEPGVFRVDAEYVSSGLRRWLLAWGAFSAAALMWWWRRTGGATERS